MAATATLEFDGDDFELRFLDRLLMERQSIPITDDLVYPSNRSESFINSLEIAKITTPVILTKLVQTTSCCAICTDDFDVDDNLTQLPYCRHWFHHECILPWLKRKSTCPLCRQELFLGKELDDMMDIDIITQNQQFFSNFEDENFIMEMLDQGLNIERDVRQSMETDFGIISQNEQLFSSFSSVSEEELQQAIDILSESLNTTQNPQLFSNLSESEEAVN